MLKTEKYIPTKTLSIIGGLLLSLSISACDNSPSQPSEPEATSEVTEAKKPLEKVAIEYGAGDFAEGISFGEMTMGSPDAKLTIIEYGSLACGACATFDRETFGEIKKNYIETGVVKYIFRNQLHGQHDLIASMITRCSPPQKTWAMMGLFFEKQPSWLKESYIEDLASLARRAGMNRAKFDACVNNSDLQKSLVELHTLSNSEGVTATPTFFIGDEKVVGAISYTEFSQLIEKNL